MKKIKVITGGIGCGKSYVCDILKQRGISVYDCDSRAKWLMQNNKFIISELTNLIGEKAYIGQELNKPAIAQFLLDNPENNKAINSIVHPIVADDFLKSEYTWLESAIYFESNFGRNFLDSYLPYIICVSAPLETRINRIIHRDNIDREKALEWIERQMAEEDKKPMSNFVIINDGEQDLDKQIDTLLTSLP